MLLWIYPDLRLSAIRFRFFKYLVQLELLRLQTLQYIALGRILNISFSHITQYRLVFTMITPLID